MRRLCWLVLCVAIIEPLHAQARKLQISGEGLAFLLQEDTRGTAGSHTEVLAGAEARLRLGPASLSIRGLLGSTDRLPLAAVAGNKNTRVTAVSLRLHPASWLSIGAEAQAMKFDAEPQTGSPEAVWRLVGPAVGLSGGLGVDGLSGRLAYAYFPSASSAPAGAPGATLDRGSYMEVGLHYDATRGPFSVRLAYRGETYEFKESSGLGTGRSGLIVGVGLKLGRPTASM